ncbi:MAG: hypothetical protein VYD90_13110 [Pseudomonadota bacterium]|uniref:hypothetical protein n=1 Tax=Novosphingobium sp. MBES04 TaxID=1206458 RepID=UPI00057E8076|nr:hypothetical protein [Novosphingobium sp. MBES04]MED5546182.1 hypothetical protein [Pseudomonadota bacterium]GAM04824.1 hypothetical protein MBENS4_1822 [Novosphingobium sp. MBES04]
MEIWLQWAIIAFIVLAIGYVVFRGGAANPEGTGHLGRKVNEISKNMNTLSGRVGYLEADLDEMKREVATIKDIERIEERIATVRAELGGHRELSQRTNHSVDRIERMLIERGLGK